MYKSLGLTKMRYQNSEKQKKKRKENQWAERHLSKERNLVKMVYHQSDPEGRIIFR